MDADLFEHLNNTITNDPNDQQHPDHPDNDKQQGQGSPDPPSRNNNAQRPRTMSSSLPEEIDQVVHAISSSQWAARLGNLMGTVKKQGETVFETTKEKASKEFDNVRSGLAAFASPQTSPTDPNTSRLGNTGATITESSQQRSVEPTSPPRISAGLMFSYLKSTADAAQKKFTPTLKELSKAEDAADAYLNRLGTSFGQLLKDVVTIDPPEESVPRDETEGDVLFDTSIEKPKKIYASRLDTLLHELHTSPNILLQNPDTSKDPGFSTWQNNFSAESYTDEIASLLDRYSELRSEMDSLVPEKVSYKDFWMRYLYQKSKIDTDEARRKQLFESNEDENDFDWDGDDEADDTKHGDTYTSQPAFNHERKPSTKTVKPTTSQQAEPAPRKSSTSESSTSFDIVSQSSAIPPMTMEKVPQSREESDDDWE